MRLAFTAVASFLIGGLCFLGAGWIDFVTAEQEVQRLKSLCAQNSLEMAKIRSDNDLLIERVRNLNLDLEIQKKVKK